MESTGDPGEFMSHSKWERLAILLAGPAMNIVLSILILTALFMAGVERPAGLDDPVDVRFVAEDSPASRSGVQPGDRIVRIDGDPVASWKDALDKFIVSANDTLVLSVERDAQTIEIPSMSSVKWKMDLPDTFVMMSPSSSPARAAGKSSNSEAT